MKKCVCLLAACVACAGCATTRDPTWEMFRHNWNTAEATENNADGRAVAEAEAKMLGAMLELRTAISKNSTAGANDRTELASLLLGREIDPAAPVPVSFTSPEKLERDMSNLLQEASNAPTWQIMQFRESLKERANPDGMDPVRRAILDNELRVRQDARRQGR